VLRLATIEGESLHFAGQFDRPFLLGSTGTQIAKVVGDLTNISLLYAAVREANRRRLDFASKLKVRQGDVERIREEVARYRSLPSLLDAAAEAGLMVSEAEEARAKARRLEARIDEVVQASDRLSEVKVVDIPEIDWGAIVTTAQQAERLRGLIVQVDAARMGEERAAEDAESFAAEAVEVDRQAHALLAEAGTCPLCGQSTKELASA
jgi:DNA repair exonuclease SbcCD ATPase subunit